MKFPFQAVRRLFLCTASPLDSGGGGNVSSLSSPDKKKHRAEVDVDKNVTPLMASAAIGNDGVVLGQQQQPSPGDGDDDFDGVGEDENNIVNSMTDEEIVNGLSELCLEESLDNVDEDSKPAASGEVICNTDPTYQLRGGKFAEWYDGLLSAPDEEQQPLKAFIIELVKWVNNIDLHSFGSAKEMETEFNQKRDEIKENMIKALKMNDRGDLVETINLASKFSIGTLIVFFLHYAPEGCNPTADDDCNFCRLDQVSDHCCFAHYFIIITTPNHSQHYYFDSVVSQQWQPNYSTSSSMKKSTDQRR